MLSVLSTYQVHTYLRSTYLVHTWGKKYVPSTYLGIKVRTQTEQYKAVWLYYDTIPEYKVVLTGLYQVRTTVHYSRRCNIRNLALLVWYMIWFISGWNPVPKYMKQYILPYTPYTMLWYIQVYTFWQNHILVYTNTHTSFIIMSNKGRLLVLGLGAERPSIY